MHVSDNLENVVREMQRQNYVMCYLHSFIHFSLSILFQETGAVTFEGKTFMVRLFYRYFRKLVCYGHLKKPLFD